LSLQEIAYYPKEKRVYINFYNKIPKEFKPKNLSLNMTKEEQQDYGYASQINIRDLEEKQRLLKDRMLLIGQNLIEIKERTESEITELKRSVEELKQTLERVKSFLETASSEFSKFARKEELEILRKQAKMFQPLEFVRKSDLEKLKNN